jgi:hypothetical protein
MPREGVEATIIVREKDGDGGMFVGLVDMIEVYGVVDTSICSEAREL